MVRAALTTPAQPLALDAVPVEAWRRFWPGAPFQSGPDWWRCVVAAGLPAGARPIFLLARDGVLPLRCERGGLASLGTPYTLLYQPLLAADADLRRTGEAWGRVCGAAVLRLDDLDQDWPAWPGLLAGFAAAGWRARWFDSFGNWHEGGRDQPIGDFATWLSARPGALRETIRRRLARAERDPAIRFELARDPAAAAAAYVAYQTVAARSWKQPEPFPAFGGHFVAAAAAAGILRAGVLWRDGTPVAAQYWTLEDGVASVHKLAHDEAARAASPGTVLTAWMVRALLAEGARGLDFGRGDDGYKQGWVSRRRQRRGLLLARPWRPSGAAALLRQDVGEWRRRLAWRLT